MLAQLKAVFRPFLIYFGMSSAELPFIKDTTPCSVVMYHDWFMRDPLDWEIYRVVEVKHYKTMDSASQHEKIIAKITTAEYGVYGYLCFERRRGSAPQTVAEFFSEDSTDTQLQSVRYALIQDGLQVSGSSLNTTTLGDNKNDFVPKCEPISVRSSKSNISSGSCSGSSFSSSLDSLQLKANAEDTVTQVDGYPPYSSPKKSIQLVETLNPRRELFLYELVVLAYTIHTKNPIYIVFREQCYWFANTIMAVLGREYGHNGAAVDIMAMDEHVDEVLPGAGGKWHSIRVHKATESILSIITVQFQRNMEAFRARAHEVRSAEERVKEDRSARVLAEQMAKHAEAKAKDSEAKAEEQVKKDRLARLAAEARAKQAEAKAKDLERRARDSETKARDSEDKVRQALLEVAKLKKQLGSGTD